MSEVTLEQMLAAREKRVAHQHRLLQKHNCPLICFTMNIAGPVKNTPLIQRGFRTGMDLLEQALPKKCIREHLLDISDTGNTAMYAVDMDGITLKQICTNIEDRTPLGRLFDMDVLTENGAKLERKTHRGCIVCGAPGRGCAASRNHSVAQLQEATFRILHRHFATADRDLIAAAAVQCLVDEVNTTPKPGLVDRRNNGSHTDMSIHHFINSANALLPYFAECVEIGQETSDQSPQNTFPLLRQAGLVAEKTMYEATKGVNTHKGAIYTLGILCGSIGRLWSPEKPIANISEILSECAKIVQDSVKSDFAAANGSTAGQRAYLKYGIGGIRGEVAAGLPSVTNIGLPSYQKALDAGLSPNDAGVIALLHLIAQVEDTNLYHRGGRQGAIWAAESAQMLLQASSNPSIQSIEQLDDSFIAQNLSPGGCADLLAATYFLHSLKP
ncbi:MAG: triphosphoribosyl-dephospho-CoA synthase CitG [Oscillospiraceae bacterium]|nr:triphosphoribosyl-dephospho-CoA synthase CitG [Oscillospiraceae bacterium]